MTRRIFGGVMILVVTLMLSVAGLHATVLTPYTHVTADSAVGLPYEQWYYIDAYNSSTHAFVGEVGYRGSGGSVTYNGDGTVTLPLADLKAIVGSTSVDIEVWLDDPEGFYESTVAILD